MPVKKTTKKRAVKKVASSAGAIVPLQPKSIGEVVKFLQDNPDYGAGLQAFFEGRRDELLSMSWSSANGNFDQKCAAVACYLTDEILSLDFGKK
jgi:hypothetical protein